MEPLMFTTEKRAGKGKGPARRLRARGLVPGVFYGPGGEPVQIAAAPKELAHALATPHRRNALLRIAVDGKEQLAMIKELQIHPLTREIRHFDLYRVELD